MRGVCLALVLSSSPALADASISRPPRSSPQAVGVIEGAFHTGCANRLAVARTEIAALAPVFANAVIEESAAPGSLDGRIERVELRLDESLVAGAKPFLFVAQISTRRSLWGDDLSTAREWTPTGSSLSIYRQTHRFEGQITAHGVAPLISPLTVQRTIELYLKPAVEDCLRRFD